SVRMRKKTMPIIMVTGQRTIEQKEVGLDSGADDYLTKPFDLRELSARVRAILRRSSSSSTNALHARDVVLDPFKRTVTRAGVPVKLRPTEFALLEYLMRHPDRVYTPDQLLESVWHSGSDATIEAVRTTVKRIRKELNDEDGEGTTPLIETVRGVGYKLCAQ
ncbi:MAG: winged helix-turn-helix domain-containing protein, partial [Terriglobales bacterium]